MHVLENLSYVLEDMLEPIAKKQDISPTELDNVYKAVKTMNYIETIKAMKEYGNSNDGSSYARGGSNRGNSRASYEGGMSNRGSYEGMSNRGSYEGGMSNRGSYEGGMSNRGSYEGSYDGRRGMDGDGDGRYSERRGRDARGRYTSRDSYSRAEGKEEMLSRLERMLSEASSEEERQAIMECMRKIDN